jgi:hypothetical protein
VGLRHYFFVRDSPARLDVFISIQSSLNALLDILTCFV